jgi:hypothetical protein
MPNYSNCDLGGLSDMEKKMKHCRELNTVFRKYGKNGLSIREIHHALKKLGYTGYNCFTPDAVIRGSISRWNKNKKIIVRGKKNVGSLEKVKRSELVYFLLEDYKERYCNHVIRRNAARKIIRFVKAKIGDSTLEEFLWNPKGPVARSTCEQLANGTSIAHSSEKVSSITIKRKRFFDSH